MNSKPASLAELAEVAGGQLDKASDGARTISKAAPIQAATADDISFLANSRYTKFLSTTGAGALVLDPATPWEGCPVIRHDRPYVAFARILERLYPGRPRLAEGVHASAIIDISSQVDETTAIGAFAHVGRSSRIGARGQLGASVFVGEDVVIGNDCLLYPGVRIMSECRIGDRATIHSGVVIGSDGFGFAPSDQGLVKVKQVGWVEIGDDVEIGANTTIDRGALGATRVGSGTKIDNLVQIAHNVEIGKNCIIVGQVGISGSTKLGDGVALGGQVGLAGHIELGDGVQVGAKSGLSKSIPAGKRLFGYPAREARTAMKVDAALSRLPDLFKRVRKLEDK